MYKSKFIDNKCVGVIKSDGSDFYILDKNNPTIPFDANLCLSGLPRSPEKNKFFKKTIEYSIFCSFKHRILVEKFPEFKKIPISLIERTERRKRYHGLKSYALKQTNIALSAARANADLEALRIAKRFKEDRRGLIYNLALKSDRVKQFIEAFPVAGVILSNHLRQRHYKLYLPFADHPDYAADYAFDMIKDIENGIKLKIIINKYKYPNITLKKIKPLASSCFGLNTNLFGSEANPLKNDLLIRLVNNYLPQQSMRQYRWAITINSLMLHRIDIQIIEWFVKNLDFSRKLIDILRIVDDMQDYIINAQNIIGVRKFNKNMSFASAVEASAQWHEMVVARKYIGNIPESTEFSEPWIKEYSDDKYNIVPLTTVKGLLKESSDMHHCVSSYAQKIIDGKSYVYSVIKNNKKVATVEIVKRQQPQQKFVQQASALIMNQSVTLTDVAFTENPKFETAQLRGYCNSYVDEDVAKVVGNWVYEANKELS